MSADSSRSFDSHDQPSPIFSQSMPPSAAAAFASPTFHLPDLTNWKTPQRYPRAHERMQHPERGGALALARAGDDDHQRPVARLAALGLGAAPVAGTMRDVDAVAAVAGERALGAHAALLEGRGGDEPVDAAAGGGRERARRGRRGPGPPRCRRPRPPSAARPSAAAARGIAPSGSWTRPSVRTTAIARRVGSRSASRRTSSSRGVAARPPAACGRRSAARRSAAAARSSGAPGRDQDLRGGVAEGDDGDAVAAGVGVAQQARAARP